MIDLTTIPDAELADAYFAKLDFDPDKEDDETLEVIAELERRGLSITDLDQIVQRAAEEEAATLQDVPLNMLGGLWIIAVDQMIRSRQLAVEIELERRGKTTGDALDAINEASLGDGEEP